MAANVASFLANARGPTAAAAKIISLDEVRSRRGAVDDSTTEAWSLEVLRGRLTELSASGAVGTLSAAMELVLEAQVQGETVAWIGRASTFGGIGGVGGDDEEVDAYWTESAAAAAGGMVAPAVGSRSRGVARVPADRLAEPETPARGWDSSRRDARSQRNGDRFSAFHGTSSRSVGAASLARSSEELGAYRRDGSHRDADPDTGASPGLAWGARRESTMPPPVARGMAKHHAEGGCFYPPDLIDSGIDLAALVVVRAPDVKAMARAAERMLRSGGFGLVIMDLVEEVVASDLLGGTDNTSGSSRASNDGGEMRAMKNTRAARLENEFSMAHQGRLVSLAQAHDAAIVCITEKTNDTASMGSLVSLRVEALHKHLPTLGKHEYQLELRALKDKRRGPGWTTKFRRRGPGGL